MFRIHVAHSRLRQTWFADDTINKFLRNVMSYEAKNYWNGMLSKPTPHTAVNQFNTYKCPWLLGHYEGRSFPRGAKIFWNMSNIFKVCPTHFSRGGAKNFLGVASPPPWLQACSSNLTWIFTLVRSTIRCLSSASDQWSHHWRPRRCWISSQSSWIWTS